MDPWLLAVVAFFTSAVSGALGMAGGMILMGALVLLLDPGQALLVHAVLQLVANGHRAWSLRSHVVLRVPALQLAGALPMLALAALLRVTVERHTMLGLLGAIGVLGALVSSPERPRLPLPAAESTAGGLFSGALLGLVNVTAGVSGPLLDLFFVESRLDRFGIVATKAVCASVGHVTKMAYALALFSLPASALSPELLLPALPCVVLGTEVGKRVLSAMGDRSFRQATRATLACLGIAYLARAVLL